MAATKNTPQSAIFNSPPLLGFVAATATERSRLLVSLLGELKTLQLRVAVLSQSTAGRKAGSQRTDFKAAGAELVLTAADEAGAFAPETVLHSAVVRDEVHQQLNPDDMDLVLVDGFAELAFARIEIHRPSTGKPPEFTVDKSIIAVAADEYLDTGGLPLLNVDSSKEVAGYINRWLHSHRPATA